MADNLERRLNTAPMPRNLVENLRKAGHDIVQMARDIGVDPLYIESGLTPLEADALFVKAYEVIGDPAICLKVGMEVDPKLYNFSPLYAMIGATLAIGMERHATFSPLVLGFLMRAEINGQYAELKIDSAYLEFRPYCFAKVDYHFTSMLGFMRLTTEKPIKPRYMKLRRPEPDFAALYQEKFDCPVTFSDEENVMAITLEDYNSPQLTYNPAMEPLFAEAVDQLMHDLQDDSIKGRVRRALETNADLREVSLASLAKTLVVSERTLQRRLSEEKVTFAELLDGVRQQFAMRALAFKEMNNQELAYRLGFANVNSFYRAFKRWTGETVERFRRTQMG
ncbi:AraC family transcriptional regulator ligand-binding domain-containing protein [Rhizobium sp. TH2]|uniref:helix-turn-helix domain-containing protein n=1 Tax=Rhizobium sp. TH2 TaxID=2775403 RepID=UPI002157781C|nr:AraC family transcriptional regulator [Rhizobium sp. TH2]UVC10385.1 AraC family transcriptional regulator ligand-binding domain-containing protein [Rhizobium sp. TH2]